MKWQSILIIKCKEILTKGGEVRFIVYRRQEKRKPIIRVYPDNEIICEDEEVPEED